MKPKRLFIRSLLFLCLDFEFHSFATEPAPATLKVVRLKGNACYSTNEHDWLSLAKGDLVAQGYIIQTAANSSLDLLPGTETNLAHTADPGSSAPGSRMIRIYECSTLCISALGASVSGEDEVSETQLDLRIGEIMGHIENLSAASRYQINFANGLAVTREATYKMDSSGWLRVQAGSLELEVAHPDNSTLAKLVAAGFQYNPATDEVTPISKGWFPRPGQSSTQPMVPKARSFPSPGFRIPLRPGV